MGTHQPHGWERIKRGSAAAVALRSARIPLLCVPEAVRPAEPPPARAHIPQLRTVLAATDLSPAGNRSVLHACALLRGAGGLVELCHVREHKMPAPSYAYEAGQDALSPERRTELEARLRALIPDEATGLGIDVHVTVVAGGTPAEAILQTARRLGADAICVASHGRSGISRAVLGSVAQTIVATSELPVYVVRPERT